MPPRITPPAKTKRLSLNVAPDTLATLLRISEHYSVSQTEVIRQLIVRERDALIAEGWRPPNDHDVAQPVQTSFEFTTPIDAAPLDVPPSAPPVEPLDTPLSETLPATEDAPEPILVAPPAASNQEAAAASETISVDDHVSVTAVPATGIRGGRAATKVDPDELDALLAAI
jgi:hypothetical protein